MAIEDTRARVDSEEEYITLKRYDYSVEKLSARHPDGCPDRIIASAMARTEEEVRDLRASAVSHIQEMLGVVKEE